MISGSKVYITNGTQADWFCMLVRTSDEGGYRGMSQIIVPADTPGFEVARKLGNCSSDTVELRLEDVRVPVTNTIGEAGRGFQQQMGQFVMERLSVCFTAVGACEWALAKTKEYIETRDVFGAPLATRQYPVFRLTELSAQLELLRALNEQMCRRFEDGEDITREATIGKLTAGRLMREVADAALQYHGGMGYMEENWTSRFYRDVRLSSTSRIRSSNTTPRRSPGGCSTCRRLPGREILWPSSSPTATSSSRSTSALRRPVGWSCRSTTD